MNKEINLQKSLSRPKGNFWRPIAAAAVAGSIGFADSREYHSDLESAYRERASEHILHLEEERYLSIDRNLNGTPDVSTEEELVGPVNRPLTENEIRNIVGKAFYEANLKIASGEVSAAGIGAVTPISNGGAWVKELNPNDDVWAVLADCESGDGQIGPPYYVQWGYNGPSGFDGALQFHPGTWRLANNSYDFAWQAPPDEQIATAKSWLQKTSWKQWPACRNEMLANGYREEMLAEGSLE